MFETLYSRRNTNALLRFFRHNFYKKVLFALNQLNFEPISLFPNNQACPWEWDSHEMGWDSTHCISHGTYWTEIDEQEIENLLNEHSDSEYECQNGNEL